MVSTMILKAAKPGSISSGTMSNEDLIPAFMEKLDEIREEIAIGPAYSTDERPEETMERSNTVGMLDGILGEIEGRMHYFEPQEEIGGVTYFESEEADCDLEELRNRLQDFAPPFHYFGAHEGDGADYGYWLNEEELEDAIENGSVIRVGAQDVWPEDEIQDRKTAGILEYVLVMHPQWVDGKPEMLLINSNGDEVWSI